MGTQPQVENEEEAGLHGCPTQVVYEYQALKLCLVYYLIEEISSALLLL